MPTKRKPFAEPEIDGEKYRFFKSRDKKRVNIYKVGKRGQFAGIKAQKRNSQSLGKGVDRVREKNHKKEGPIPPPPPPSDKIYRSSLVMGYQDPKLKTIGIEVRVWIHSNEKLSNPLEMLSEWIDKAYNALEMPMSLEEYREIVSTILRSEENAEIEKDEMAPNDEIDKRWGVVFFHLKTKAYYLEQSGNSFKRRTEFVKADV